MASLNFGEMMADELRRSLMGLSPEYMRGPRLTFTLNPNGAAQPAVEKTDEKSKALQREVKEMLSEGHSSYDISEAAKRAQNEYEALVKTLTGIADLSHSASTARPFVAAWKSASGAPQIAQGVEFGSGGPVYVHIKEGTALPYWLAGYEASMAGLKEAARSNGAAIAISYVTAK